jgi:hypothetical protein
MRPTIDAMRSRIWVSIRSCDLPVYNVPHPKRVLRKVYLKYPHNAIKSVLKREGASVWFLILVFATGTFESWDARLSDSANTNCGGLAGDDLFSPWVSNLPVGSVYGWVEERSTGGRLESRLSTEVNGRLP